MVGVPSSRTSSAQRGRNRGSTAARAAPRSALAEEIDRRLARAGQRWTKGRRAVLDALANGGAPMSVPDLQASVGAAVPLSSLYRVIADLVDAKVLTKLEFREGFARFELAEELAEHHHHLVCTQCSKVIDLELPDLEAAVDGVAAHVRKRNGFTVHSHRIDFFGLCDGCRPAPGRL